jgi:hypothetical protein
MFAVVDMARALPSPDLGPACPASTDANEPGNASCDGALALSAMGENQTKTTHGQIFVAGDVDTFSLELDYDDHFCDVNSDDIQYVVRAELTPPPGVALHMHGALDGNSCSEQWSNWATQSICFKWTDACETPGAEILSLQVAAIAEGAASCFPYSVQLTFCNANDPCGC